MCATGDVTPLCVTENESCFIIADLTDTLSHTLRFFYYHPGCFCPTNIAALLMILRAVQTDLLLLQNTHTHTLTQFLKPNQTSGCVLRVSMYHHDHDIVLADKKMSVDPCICVGAEI